VVQKSRISHRIQPIDRKELFMCGNDMQKSGRFGLPGIGRLWQGDGTMDKQDMLDV
jgi:hypothetical protein